MKRHFLQIRYLVPLLIISIIMAIPLTRRYAALQLGWERNAAPQIISSAFAHSANTDSVRNDNWNRLIHDIQYKRDFNYTDEYLYQHSDEVILLTERARYLLENTYLPSRGGELEALPPSPSAPKGISLPDEDIAKRQAESKVLLQRVNKLCLLGKKQEPQNGYFDLMLSIVAYAQYRDEEGWNYLQSALKAPSFNTHHFDFQKLLIDVDKRTLARPLLWEENYSIRAGIMFPELRCFRSWARWLAWKAIVQMRYGDISKAVKIQQSLSQMGMRIIANANYEITASVGSAVMAIAYYAPLQNLKVMFGPHPPKMSQEQRYFWVQDFAKRRHLPQLQEIGTDYLRGKRYLVNMLDINAEPTYFNLSITHLTIMLLSWQLGVWSFLVAGGSILFLLLTLLVRKPDQLPTARQIAQCAFATIFISLVLISGLYAVAYSGDRWDFNIWAATFSGDTSFGNLRIVALLFPIFIAFSVAAFLVIFTPLREKWRALKNSSWKTRGKVLLVVLAFLLVPALLYFANENWPFLYSEMLRAPADSIYRLYLSLTAGSFSAYANNTLATSDVIMDWEFAITYFILGGIYFWLLWKCARHLRQKKQHRHLFYLMRHALIPLVLACVIIYGVTMISTVMSRQYADQKTRPFMTRGDMSVYADKADLSGPVDPHRLFEKIEEINKHRIMRL